MEEVLKIEKDIKDLNIQGATNVAISTLEGMKIFVKNSKEENPEELLKMFLEVGNRLAYARPNEPLAQNGVKYVKYHVEKSKNDLQNIQGMKQSLEKYSDEYLDLIATTKRGLVDKCLPFVKMYETVLTHCHSSTAVSMLKSIGEGKESFEVVCTETRPLYQGRKTAKSLIDGGISTTMIADSAAESFVIGRGNIRVDAVFIGCDEISMSGHCVNKIGSWGIAMASNYASRPVYIVSPLLKVDPETFGRDIKIEIREDKEIWSDAPEGLDMYNPAFEIVDKNLISGFLTEFGIVKPNDVAQVVRSNYPWLFES